MRADVIHVMESGKVVESGSHEQLMALEGLYVRPWKAQMRAGAEPFNKVLSPPLAQTAYNGGIR